MNRTIIRWIAIGLYAMALMPAQTTQAQFETQTFNSEASAKAAGWLANDEARNPDRNIDLGWKNSNHAGGAAPGEGGGLLHRSGTLPIGFYADTTIGEFTLEDPLMASGKVTLINQSFDGRLFWGFFDAQRILADPFDFGAILGFSILEPNNNTQGNYRWGYGFVDNFGITQLVQDAWSAAGASGLPDKTPMDFSIEYDPTDDGLLTLTIGDEPPYMVFLGEGLTEATYTGFGVFTDTYTNSTDSRALELFLDDVTYSSTVGGGTPLQAGDADQDLDFDQLDLVQVQIATKYLSGQAATWGEGDWNGAPGGSQGSPPAGDGLFNQLDIIAALNSGVYLTGPYGAVSGGGVTGDGQTSVGYDVSTGEVWVDAPAGTELTSINIDSAAGIFTTGAAQNLGGSFDNDADGNIFKATFGGSFGSLSFGNIAQTGLSEASLQADLTVVGSLAGGGDLGEVDLIYVPEPATVIITALGLLGMLAIVRCRRAGDQ